MDNHYVIDDQGMQVCFNLKSKTRKSHWQGESLPQRENENT